MIRAERRAWAVASAMWRIGMLTARSRRSKAENKNVSE